jgi:hypothetical protein
MTADSFRSISETLCEQLSTAEESIQAIGRHHGPLARLHDLIEDKDRTIAAQAERIALLEAESAATRAWKPGAITRDSHAARGLPSGGLPSFQEAPMQDTPIIAELPRASIDRVLDEVIRREGGYVNHPADRGGPTKFGITMGTLQRWRGDHPVTADDVCRLTEAEARQIYRQRYVIAPGYAGIKDPQLVGLMVDCCVLYGEDDASPWLQQAAKDLGADLAVDGKVGPRTLAAVNAIAPERLIRRICAARLRKMGRVITEKPSQAAFAAGWSNRLAEFVEA